MVDDGRPTDPGVDAVVADLDSLRQGAQDVLTLLREWCVVEATALLFISVFPLELRSLRHAGPYDELQPPYPPDELSERIRRLLERAGSRSASLDRSILKGTRRRQRNGE